MNLFVESEGSPFEPNAPLQLPDHPVSGERHPRTHSVKVIVAVDPVSRWVSLALRFEVGRLS